ncbi:hypothetical protein EI94DRAFT_1786113 [Lactarius quietus]|nr:hypothetical protein EI94DRAFT_1786113 [Lactarius quietus]
MFYLSAEGISSFECSIERFRVLRHLTPDKPGRRQFRKCHHARCLSNANACVLKHKSLEGTTLTAIVAAVAPSSAP